MNWRSEMLRREPDWHRLRRGCYLAYRKMSEDGSVAWIARARDASRLGIHSQATARQRLFETFRCSRSAALVYRLVGAPRKRPPFPRRGLLGLTHERPVPECSGRST